MTLSAAPLDIDKLPAASLTLELSARERIKTVVVGFPNLQ